MFETLLVANRGEIARRVMRTAHAMGIRCVAVYTDADRCAPHVVEADAAFELPAGGHLDVDALLAVARRSGATAVHPGYGYLSENARFAQAVVDAGLVWVGPSPDAIATMGDKLAAKRLAEDNDVPTLPSSDNPEHGDSLALGLPVLVKAAAGGGGKGMRIVRAEGELVEAVAAARREANSAFGDDRVFLERYVERARHVEIQILGDHHGTLLHLGERECSIQRRHQKIVEESPSPRVDAGIRTRMGEAALRLGRALDYRSAGTVEFLLDDDTGEFWFLEVNTRLQVEHPITEAVTGVDLVRAQLLIAAGHALDPDDRSLPVHGHAIEARLYAEDAWNGFLPATGTLTAWTPAPHPHVRIDSAVEEGSVVGVDFDPMLAKVVAHAETRLEAAGRLALALERMAIAGVVTNRDFLVSVLRSPAFLAGDTTTDFIDRVAPAPRPRSDEERRAAAVAVAVWSTRTAHAVQPVLAEVPAGWRNSAMPPEVVTLADVRSGGEWRVALTVRRDGTLDADGQAVAVVEASADRIDCAVDGRRVVAHVSRHGDTVHLHDGTGDVELVVVPRFPEAAAGDVEGSLTAPMPGKVLDVRVGVGDRVVAGQVLVVLEAMKMEHHLASPADGVVVEVDVAVGDQVDNGATLLVVDEGGST